MLAKKKNRYYAIAVVLLLAAITLTASCDQAESTQDSNEITPTNTVTETQEPISIAPPDDASPPASDQPLPQDGRMGEMPTDRRPPMGSENMSPPMSSPGIMLFLPDTGELAELLGITEEELEDAFAQAQEELLASSQPPFDAGEFPPEEPTANAAPDAINAPDSILARVAEILGIDPETFEEALAQVSDAAPPPAP